MAQPRAGFDLANYGVSVEPDKRVMVVLAALDSAQVTDASGVQHRAVDVQLSPAGTQFRERLESDLAGMPVDLRARLAFRPLRRRSRSAPGACQDYGGLGLILKARNRGNHDARQLCLSSG